MMRDPFVIDNHMAFATYRVGSGRCSIVCSMKARRAAHLLPTWVLESVDVRRLGIWL